MLAAPAFRADPRRVAPRLGDEGADFVFVVADLDATVVHDDGALEDAWVRLDEVHELAHLHVIEVDVVFLYDLRTRRDDVIRPVLAFGDELADIVLREVVAENVHRLVGDLLLVEPGLDLAAARA